MAFLSFNQFVDKIDQLEEANILIAALEFRIFTHLGKKALTYQALAKKANQARGQGGALEGPCL